MLVKGSGENLMQMKEKRRNNVVNIIVLLIYISANVFLAFHHEAWRDESQAWVLARNSSFSEILALCSSEGHPCLWFFILKIFHICGLSFRHFSLISILMMVAAAMFLLWKSPFCLVAKICILFSSVFFYYNPVICRVYALVVLLTVLLCVWWPRRRSAPIIYGCIVAAIFQSHVLVTGFAIGCLIEMIIYNKSLFTKRSIIGFLIPISSLVLVFFELRQTAMTETDVHVNLSLDYLRSCIQGKGIFDLTKSVQYKFNYMDFPIGKIMLGICLIILSLFFVMYVANRTFRNSSKGIGIVSCCGIVGFWGIIVFIRPATHIQIAIVLWVLLFAFIWLLNEANKSMSQDVNNNNSTGLAAGEDRLLAGKRLTCCIFQGLFVLICLLSVPTCMMDSIADIKGPFSGSLEIADMIENKTPEESVIVLRNNYLSTSIVSYLSDSKKHYLLWDIDNGTEFVIHKWGKNNKRNITDESLYDAICSDISSNENVYFINSRETFEGTNRFPTEMKLIGQNEMANKWNEYYEAYKVENMR